jgi:hypothetical protein
VSNDRNWNIHDAINDLEDFFNMIDISNCFFEFLEHNCFLDDSFNLFNSFILVTQLDYFLILFCYFLNSFHNNWNFNDLFNNVLNISVDIDKLRNNFFNLNDSWNLNKFLFDSLDFIDLRYNN